MERKIIKPIGNNILVKADNPQEKSKGGVILTMSGLSPKYSNTGEILAIGPKVSGVDVGQRVQFHPMSVQEIDKKFGENLYFIKENNIEFIYE